MAFDHYSASKFSLQEELTPLVFPFYYCLLSISSTVQVHTASIPCYSSGSTSSVLSSFYDVLLVPVVLLSSMKSFFLITGTSTGSTHFTSLMQRYWYRESTLYVQSTMHVQVPRILYLFSFLHAMKPTPGVLVLGTLRDTLQY